MKKLLTLSLLALILILGACSKDKETSTDSQKGQNSTENLESDIKEKDNELVINVNGKKEIISAEIVENISFAKEIKVPEGAEVVKNKEDDTVIVSVGELKIGINRRETQETSEELIESYKRGMSMSEPNREVPVNDVDITNYPDLKEYDGMVKVEGTETTAYYLVKSIGEKEIEEVKIGFPVSSNDEKNVAQMIGILKSIK